MLFRVPADLRPKALWYSSLVAMPTEGNPGAQG